MGSRLVSPPGHPAQDVALITAKFADVKIAIDPPDSDLKVWLQCSELTPQDLFEKNDPNIFKLLTFFPFLLISYH